MMKKQQLIESLRRLAMGRLDAADVLADMLIGCEFCVMPGGEHFGACPNNQRANVKPVKTKAA